MKPRTHAELAQYRADLRVARKAKLEHGTPVKVTLGFLRQQRANTQRERAESRRFGMRARRGLNRWPLRNPGWLPPQALDLLEVIHPTNRRIEGARVLPDVLAHYDLHRPFVPYDEADYGAWRERVITALRYRRRQLTDPDKPFDLHMLVNVVLAYRFLLHSGPWDTSKAVHTPAQHVRFIKEFADLNKAA